MDRRYFLVGGIILIIFSVVIIGMKLAAMNSVSEKYMAAEAAVKTNLKEETKLVDAAGKLAAQGDLLKAKAAYQKIIEKSQSSETLQKAQDGLEAVNIQMLFSRVLTADSELYEVQKGDTLTRIAKKFNTTPDLIAKANGLKDNTIRTGARLKVTRAKYGIVVDKSQNILTLKSNGEIVKTYRVSTGKNSSTPVGTFNITNKIIDPPWYPASGGMIPSGDPKNVLGSRWLGISKPGYGIHGTTQPESIGKSITDGCVRLKNPDVEELYSIVPEGTEVVIVD